MPESKHEPGEPRVRKPLFPARYWKHLLWIVPLVIVDLFIFSCLRHRGAQPEEVVVEELPLEPAITAQVAVAAAPWRNFVFPTDQTQLLAGAAAGVFQPTASGNPESGTYGSVRTANNGSGLMSSFHEGIDIAALQRDRQHRPLDTVHAVADGVVGYVNRIGGNSNYGIYVVLLHNDPVGEVYTLYAHLAEVPKTLRAGQSVAAGETIGLMGNTSSAGIPMERAHLHFEIGLINNQRFAVWYRAQKLKPDHGNFHGRNFLGVNPLSFMAFRERNPDTDFRSYLRSVPPAFEVVVAAGRRPDFFSRYPALWDGDGAPIVLSCSENGVPLGARRASSAEQQVLGKRKYAVLNADEAVLGRNGAHLLSKTSNGWKLGRKGDEWLEILTY